MSLPDAHRTASPDRLPDIFRLADPIHTVALVSAHPRLAPALTRLARTMQRTLGDGVRAHVDTVRSVRTGEVVGIVVMARPPAGADLAGFAQLSSWWLREVSPEVRGRVALGLLPGLQAANDNAR